MSASLNSEPVLALERVSVNFGGLQALSDVSFQICEGEAAGLIDPNGAGNTTIFNLITDFLSPYSINYRDSCLNGLGPHEIAALGRVRAFQRTSVFSASSVFKNVLKETQRRAYLGRGIARA